MNRHHPQKVSLWILAGITICVLISLGAGSVCAQTQPEFRAYWVESIYDAGLKSPSQVDTMMAAVRASNMNAIVIQERRRGDTYYPSNIEPWAPDADQSFDSLDYIIQKAHNESPRIDVIVWFCTFPVWTISSGWPSASKHVMNTHPEWLMKFSNGATNVGKNYYLDPGNPAVEDYTISVVMDVLNRYDVDGINFDYVRYPEDQYGGVAEWGYNDVAVARFNTLYGRTGTPPNSDPDWKQFRRDQVTAFVRKMYANMLAVKPDCKMTADTVTWGGGPSTDAGWTSTSAYSSVFQDWRAWMEEGILDMNMPMTYDDQGDSTEAGYFDSWTRYQKSHKYNRQLSIGMGAYMNNRTGLYHQIGDTRSAASWNGQTYYADGQQLYDYGDCSNESLSATSLAPYLVSNVYPTPVPVPDMLWKSSPTKGHIKGTAMIAGTPIDGVAVNLVGTSRPMKTDGTGFYAFIDLTSGTYTVSITYGGTTKTVTVPVTAGTMATADFDFVNDATPPVITGIQSLNVTNSTASIQWNTDDYSTGQVEYGTTTAYGSSTTLNTALLQSHSANLSGLLSGQLYHYRVRSRNGAGLETVSGDYTFTTYSDTTAPVISNMTVTSVSDTTATITWTTDDIATSMVQYGPSSSYGYSTVEDTNFVNSHSVAIGGLTPNAVYHFRVKSTNNSSLTSYSTDYSFMTHFGSADVIMDDLQGTCTGTWTSQTDPGGWPIDNSEYRAVPNTKVSTSATFTWTPNIPVSGLYNVYVWYKSGADRTTGAPFTIHYDGGFVQATVNQTTNGSSWVKIANLKQFNVGGVGRVLLKNNTLENDGTKVVVADAIKFEPANSDTTVPTVPTNLTATATSSSQIQLTWSPSTDNTGVVGYAIYRGGMVVGNSATTSFTDTGLAANTSYTYTVTAYDAKNNESAQSTSAATYTLALSPTVAVSCNRNADQWYNSSSFVFGNTGFGAGKVDRYRYAWDSSPTHTWTDAETLWTTSFKVVSMPAGATGWYFHVKSYNAQNVGSGTFDLGPYHYEMDIPTMANVTVPKYIAIRDGASDDLSASWLGNDNTSGVAEYQYAIGTTAGGVDVLGWTSAGANNSATYHFTAPRSPGNKYYWTVKAKDQASNWSTVMNSTASTYAIAFSSLAAAANNPDNTLVIIDPALVVSADFDTYSYVQESNRTRGIRLGYSAPAWLPGDLVSVAGKLGITGSERQLTDVECRSRTAGTGSPFALGMNIATIGGVAPDPFTSSVAGAKGPFNLGLLVRVAGKVTSTGGGYFILDDASGATVKVYSTKAITGTPFVGATGICCLEGGERVIRTRSEDDVQIYAP